MLENQILNLRSKITYSKNDIKKKTNFITEITNQIFEVELREKENEKKLGTLK